MIICVKAVEIAQNALLATLPDIKPGAREEQIANQLVINLLKLGCEPDLALQSHCGIRPEQRQSPRRRLEKGSCGRAIC